MTGRDLGRDQMLSERISRSLSRSLALAGYSNRVRGFKFLRPVPSVDSDTPPGGTADKAKTNELFAACRARVFSRLAGWSIRVTKHEPQY